MNKALLLFTLCLLNIGYSQNISDYEYVVLPNKFEFQKTDNQYNISMLAKMMFEKYGYVVFFENSQKPEGLALNRCKALYGDVQNNSGFLTTSLVISLKDCTGKTVFTSETGKSKEKDYKTAYHEALRKAAVSFDNLNYRRLGKEREASIEAVTQTQTSGSAVAPGSASALLPVIPDETLFAQPISNGFQLVDSRPQVVLRIYKTSKADSYTAIANSYNGLVFKKGEDWFFEYYKDDVLVSEKLSIKF